MTCGEKLPAALAAASSDTCCWGAVLDGPAGCTCWTPEYDRPQAQPDTTTPIATRSVMCGTCAYREGTQASRKFAGQLDDLAGIDGFHCHQGTRRVVRFRHPNGTVIDRAAVDHDDPTAAPWDPPLIGNTPYRADGQPAPLCAGWARHRHTHTATPPAADHHPEATDD